MGWCGEVSGVVEWRVDREVIGNGELEEGNGKAM
jgi:hypothetical protein